MPDKNAYFDYLTKRLDSGESKNIVISTTVDIISKQLRSKKTTRVLDVGCFSGAMLNRINQELPSNFRDRVSYVGIDSDQDAMQHGSNKYGLITFVQTNLEKKINLVKQYDVIILCNVLHELFPNEEIEIRRERIKSVFQGVSKLLNGEGEIILLDGIRPNDADKEIEIELVNETWRKKFEKLVKEYTAASLTLKNISKNKIKTNKFTLSVFLTKARYLDKEYWTSEAEQLYQYFSAKDFEGMINKSGLHVEEVTPQALEIEKATEMIIISSLSEELPAKNVLIVAKNC